MAWMEDGALGGGEDEKVMQERKEQRVACVYLRDVRGRVCVAARWRAAVKFVEGVSAGPHADFLCSAAGSIVFLKDAIVPSAGPARSLSRSPPRRVNTGRSS